MPSQDDINFVPESHKRQKVYRNRRNSFINSNDLNLHQHYHNERDNDPHLYPGNGAEVKYLDLNERENTRRRMVNGHIQNPNVETLDQNQQNDVRNGRSVMFTRRGSVSDLMMMKKQVQERGPNLPLKSNHSSMNQGRSVANAGFLKFDNQGDLQKITMNSGHYQPTAESGVKLAMWGDKTGAFDSNNVQIVDRHNNQIDTSQQQRVNVVNQWSQTHPQIQRPRRNSV